MQAECKARNHGMPRNVAECRRQLRNAIRALENYKVYNYRTPTEWWPGACGSSHCMGGRGGAYVVHLCWLPSPAFRNIPWSTWLLNVCPGNASADNHRATIGPSECCGMCALAALQQTTIEPPCPRNAAECVPWQHFSRQR